MGHKTLIGGTAYDIKGGKTLIGGTAYDIKGGKTLIGGTAYDISFAPPREQTMQALLQDVTVGTINGHNASNTAYTGINFSAAIPHPIYVLSFCNGYMSVNKVTWDGSSFTKSVIHQDSDSYGNIYTDNTNKRIRYSNKGTANNNSRSTILLLYLNNYTVSEADYIFSNATYTRQAGRNTSSTDGVYTDVVSGTHYYFLASGKNVAFSSANGTTFTSYLGTNSDNPSLLCYVENQWGDRWYYSTSGTGSTSVYACSIIEVS